MDIAMRKVRARESRGEREYGSASVRSCKNTGVHHRVDENGMLGEGKGEKEKAPCTEACTAFVFRIKGVTDSFRVFF